MFMFVGVDGRQAATTFQSQVIRRISIRIAYSILFFFLSPESQSRPLHVVLYNSRKYCSSGSRVTPSVC